MKTLLKLFVTFFLLMYLSTLVDGELFMSVLAKAKIEMLFLSFLALLASIFLQGLRWYCLVNKLIDVDVIATLVTHYKAIYADIFVPGKVGSDFLRVKNLKDGSRKKEVIISLLFMRMQGLFLLICLLIVPLLSSRIDTSGIDINSSALVLVVFLVLVGIAVLVCFKSKIIGIYVSVKCLLHANTIILTTLIYVLFYFTSVLAHYFAAYAFSVEISLSMLFILLPLIMISSVLPITIMGRGTTELFGVLVLSGASITSEEALAITTTVFVLMLIHSLFSWLVVLNGSGNGK